MLAAIPGLTVLESYNPSLQIYGVGAGLSAPNKMRFRVEPGAAYVACGEARPAYQRAFEAQLAANTGKLSTG